MTEREFLLTVRADTAALRDRIRAFQVPGPDPIPDPPSSRVWRGGMYLEEEPGVAVRRSESRVAVPRVARGLLHLDVISRFTGFAAGTFEGLRVTTNVPVSSPLVTVPITGDAMVEIVTPVEVDLTAVPFGLHGFRMDAPVQRSDGRKTTMRLNVYLYGGVGEGAMEPVRSGTVFAEGFLTTPGDAFPGSGYFIGAKLWGGLEQPGDLLTPIVLSANRKETFTAHLRLLKNDVALVPTEQAATWLEARTETVPADVLSAEVACTGIVEIGRATVIATRGPWQGVDA